ncbi:MAG: hypothetical protein ACR2HQ_03030 [Ilumatobacteraceae bacterium]
MDAHVLVLLATFALFVSSIAGYGGSLILVPALGALLGIKEGVALAALPPWNNVFKSSPTATRWRCGAVGHCSS